MVFGAVSDHHHLRVVWWSSAGGIPPALKHWQQISRTFATSRKRINGAFQQLPPPIPWPAEGPLLRPRGRRRRERRPRRGARLAGRGGARGVRWEGCLVAGGVGGRSSPENCPAIYPTTPKDYPRWGCMVRQCIPQHPRITLGGDIRPDDRSGGCGPWDPPPNGYHRLGNKKPPSPE